MSSSLVNVLEVEFLAMGRTSAVGELPDQLDGVIQQQIAIGDVLPVTGKRAAHFSVIVSLFKRPESDRVAFRKVERWLKNHSAVLSRLDARKILEFQSFIDSNAGSRIVTIPNSIVRLCGKAGIDVAHQAIRVFSKSEYARLRSTGE